MLDKMTEIIREQTGDENIRINKDSIILTDLGMNSFDLINLICILEDEFGVEIPDRVIGKFKTVGDVLEYIEGTNI